MYNPDVDPSNRVVLGRPNWDLMLRDLIASTYRVPEQLMTEKDSAVQVVLIALHEAVQGKNDIETLARLCIKHTTRISEIWTPGKG